MTEAVQFVLVFAAGGILGLFAGVFLARKRVSPDNRLELELRQQSERREVEMQALQQKLQSDLDTARELLTHSMKDLASAQANLGAEQRLAVELRSENESMTARVATAQSELAEATNVNAQMVAEAVFLKERLATERQAAETMRAQFLKDFEAISNKLLVENSSKFNQQSAESLEKLLSPFKATLGEFKTSLEATRTETVAHSALLKDQVSRIGTEAANLTKALRGEAKVLGDWGENMLDQILAKSGLQKDIHYRRQYSATDGEGDKRILDVIVDLPDRRNLIIDSKVSLRSYEDSVNCVDDVTRAEAMTKLVDALRRHFKSLGAKRYQDIYGVNAPDFVLMYIPIEGAFFAAVSSEAKLFGEALDANVVLTTNSTLLATLRTVAHVWRLADQQKNAIDIADRAGKLYDKFVGFVDDLSDVGGALSAAQKTWGKAFEKLSTGSGNLVGQVEKLKILGAKAAKALPPELVESNDGNEATPHVSAVAIVALSSEANDASMN